MTANYEVNTSGTIATPYTLDQMAAYFEAPARGNSLKSLTDILGSSLITITNPTLLPATGSPVLTGASFTNTRLTNTFFTPVTYKGAFGTTNWTSGWCNFDPQNTVY